MLLFISQISSAQEIHGAISIGKVLEEDRTFVVEMDLSLTLWLVTLYGGLKNYFEFVPPSGHPFFEIYELGARIEYEWLFADLNHWCSHAVWSGLRFEPGENASATTLKIGVQW
jgi:hypothetical protein